MLGIRKLSWLFAVMGAVLAVAAGPAAAASSKAAPIAPASARGVTEFPLHAMRIGDLAQNPDGTITYLGAEASWQHQELRLGWVGPNGPLGEAAPPTRLSEGISIDSEGTGWLTALDSTYETSLGRLAPGGAWSLIPGTAGITETTPAAGGGVWFIQNEPDPSLLAANSHLKIGRVSASGAVTAFPFAEHEAGLNSIVEGREGNAWFTESFGNKIGRITPTGQLAEFPLPHGSHPASIAVDGKGNLWFGGPETNRIGRITPSGTITDFNLPAGIAPAAITVGADGRIWFAEAVGIEGRGETGNIGRITPAGRFTQIELPDRESEPQHLITGSEGNIWYSAMGERHCEGGGTTCILWEPKNPAIVGRIAPTPLKTVVTSGQVTAGRRGVKVPVACEGGDASDHCRGVITIKAGGYKVASAKYSLEADQARALVVPFARAGLFSLGRRKSIAATVAVVATSGKGTSRKAKLSRGTQGKN